MSLHMHTDALKPFDSSAKADAILRSSDSIDFFVIKLLLCHVSPVFNVMFSSDHITAGSPGDETRNGLSIVSVTEDSTTLYYLLTLVYPSYFNASNQVDINDLCKVAKAVQKYCMDCVEGRLKTRVVSSRLMEEHAFQVYVSAIQLGWTDIAVTAASRTLATPLRDLPFNDNLRLISGADFYQYLNYRFRYQTYQDEGERDEKPQLTFDTKSIVVDETCVVVEGTLPSFGPTPKTDTILRSSDRTDFYVNKSFLAFLSPVFDAIFMQKENLPSKTDGEGNNFPIFDVGEDSVTLSCLLCFLLPYAEEPHIEHLRVYAKIWAAVQKYKVLFVAQKLERSFLASPFVHNEPLRAFSVAVTLGFLDAIKATATETLAKPFNEMAYVNEFRLITGADLFLLMEYRFKCTDAVNHLLNDPDGLGKKEYIASNEELAVIQLAPEWLVTKYIQTVRCKLQECPRGSLLTMVDDRNLTRSAKWRERGIDESKLCELLGFRRALILAIEKEISKIPVNIYDQKS